MMNFQLKLENEPQHSLSQIYIYKLPSLLFILVILLSTYFKASSLQQNMLLLAWFSSALDGKYLFKVFIVKSNQIIQINLYYNFWHALLCLLRTLAWHLIMLSWLVNRKSSVLCCYFSVMFDVWYLGYISVLYKFSCFLLLIVLGFS